MRDGLTIDWEVADQIALSSMVEHYRMIEQQLDDYIKRRTNMHPDDFARSLELLDSLQVCIEYYGGKID